MFDNPKKELKRLEEQLLAAEEELWTEDAFLPEDTESTEPEYVLPEEPELPPMPEEEAPVKQSLRIPILISALLLEMAALLGVLAWWLLWR